MEIINFKTVSTIISDFLVDTSVSSKFEQKLDGLIRSSTETNYRLWNLEDSARMTDLGLDHIAKAKQEIDQISQTRNNLIREIDTEIVKLVQAALSNHVGEFYSESPGMIIDRLAILFIKSSVIKKLVSLIEEKDLKQDYLEKEKVVAKQIASMGKFLDTYFTKLKEGRVFFEIQQPVKIYNDERIKKYIRIVWQKTRK